MGINLSDIMLHPISEQFICGSDARYDDIYLAIESEIDKMNSPEGSVQIDWQYISDKSVLLLESSTKDIKLLCWWAYAQYKLNEFLGLVQAIEMMNNIFERFNKELFPKSHRAKWGAFSWFDTVISVHLIQERQINIPLDNPERFLTQLIHFQSYAKEICETSENLFSDVCRLLEVKVAEKHRNDVSDKASASSDTTMANSNLNSEVNSDADATKVLNQLKKSGELLSNYWRTRQIDDVRALRLNRMISWLEIDELPFVQNGKTMLNPPSSDSIEQIDILISEGKNTEALYRIENMILRAPFWFVGHYKAFQLYEALHKDQAANEVKNMVKSFLRSYEGLMELTFKDGTPFIPSEIKNWLAESDFSAEEFPKDMKTVDDMEAIAERCYELVNKKNPKEAMEILQCSYRDAGSNEEKFRWRLLHAEVALAAGKPPIVQALIEELEREIERYRLEEWQPELVAKVYRFYLNSFNRSQIEREKYNSAFQRLCRVDMASAIDIK